MKRYLIFFLLLVVFPQLNGQRQMEKLDRGLHVVYIGSGEALLSWRIFAYDDPNITFNVYCITNGEDLKKLNDHPISGKSNYLLENLNLENTYEFFIRTVINGQEESESKRVSLTNQNRYLSIKLDVPSDGITPTGNEYSYTPNDCSVGDLDGDGDYEIVLKWEPTNSKDNSETGFTGNTLIDAYTLEGEKLWRIDLGPNIRSGAHYTQFMVYDLDGDGKAEIALKTAPGTKDGTGSFISDGPAAKADHTADYRNSAGMILSGPEYLTLFDGLTGQELVTTYYTPRRHPDTENPTGEQLNEIWGDSYGNRVDRFLACIAYLDGVRPSLVMCRGYYTRTVLAAYDYRGGQLIRRWVFDSMVSGNEIFAGQGNHNLSVADVDNDGKDEIIYGQMAVDDDGKGLYSTGLGHGDAMHVSDLDPTRDGLELFGCHEENGNGLSFRDARTGEIIWQHKKPGSDVGRGVAFDIDPNYVGAECWGSDGGGIYSCTTGEVISTVYPTTAGNAQTYNAGIWWDGDLLRELFDKTVITKWNWSSQSTSRILTVYNYGVSVNNGSKNNPCLIADILGDWREELILRTYTNDELRIFSTTYETDYGLYTLMHDPQYRLSIAWQNVGYNQPAHTSFFLGHNMSSPPIPNAIYVDAEHPFPGDDTLPLLSDIKDQEVAVDDNCEAYLPDFSEIAEVLDEKYISFSFIQTPPPGTLVGTAGDEIKVSLYVTDGYGNNSNVVEFNVSAIDTISPVFISSLGDQVLTPSSGCDVALEDYTKKVEAIDNCSSELFYFMDPVPGTILSGNEESIYVTVSVADIFDNSCDTTFKVTVFCNPSTIGDIDQNDQVKVYPNPAEDIIKVELSKICNLKIELFDISGESILSRSLVDNEVNVNIKGLLPGIYLLKVNVDTHKFLSFKILKK